MRFCITIVFVFLTHIAIGQQTKGFNFYNDNLEDVLNTLERRFDVSFSYASDIINIKKVTFSIREANLSQLLDILESQTSLVFEKISDTQFILSKNTAEGFFCGYVLDSETKLPIPFATISSNDEQQFSTDPKGLFRFKRSEQNTYVIRKNGYQELIIKANEECDQYYLTYSSQTLDEVIIDGYVTSGIDKKSDGVIEVNSKALGILPGLVIPDLLQSVLLIPGINSLNESVTDIQIRGGMPDQNLILYDGIVLYNTGYLYGMFSNLNPYATERARVVKSGANAVYGDRISGIIDISTGETIPEKREIGLGVDGLGLDGYLKTKLNEKMAFYFFGRGSIGDDLNTLTYEAYSEKIFRNTGIVRNIDGELINIISDDELITDNSSDFSFGDVSTKLIYELNPKNKLMLSGLFTVNSFDYSFEDDGQSNVDDLSTSNVGLSLKWKHTPSEKKTHDLSFYYSRYNSNYENQEIVDDVLEELNRRNNFIDEYGLNFLSTTTMGDRHSLSYGYQFANTVVDIENLEMPLVDDDETIMENRNDRNIKNSVFSQFNFNFKNTGFINVGLRAVHYSSMKKIYLEPRLNIEYPLNNLFRVKAGLERRNQPISQTIEIDLGELRPENNTWNLSTSDGFPILTSNQYTAGLLFNSKNWIIDIEAYFKRLNGITSFTNGYSTPFLQYEEGDSAISGVDVLINKRISNYRFWVGYTFNDVNFSFPNIQGFDFPGNNDVTHSFRISNALKLKDLEFSLGWQYRTGLPFTPIVEYDSDTNLVEFGEINSSRLPDYHRLDASITYNLYFNDWKVQLGASALNIYDRQIPLSYRYVTEDEGAGLELQQVLQQFSLGFTPNFILRVDF